MKSKRAKLGSMVTFKPPICRKKLECPINVTPSSPLAASFGLCVSPVRGVTAEWRTRRVNCPARFRSAGFFNEDFKVILIALPIHYRLSPSKSPIPLSVLGRIDGMAFSRRSTRPATTFLLSADVALLFIIKSLKNILEELIDASRLFRIRNYGTVDGHQCGESRT